MPNELCGPPWISKATGSRPARIGRLDDLAPDGVAIGAREAEPLDLDRIEPFQPVGVDRGQRHRLAGAIKPLEIVGRLQRCSA